MRAAPLHSRTLGLDALASGLDSLMTRDEAKILIAP